MIIGSFINNKIILPVGFLLSTDTILSIEFVVDTGFSGYLTLPVSAVGALNLPLFSTTITILADGTHAAIFTHITTINWHERELLVPILAMGTKPLLGMGLLDRCRLVAEFTEDGSIELEKL